MENSIFQAIVINKAGITVAVRWADNKDKAIGHLNNIRKQTTQKTIGRVVYTATGKEVYSTA